MDIISHGLWGSIAFGRRNRRDFWLSFFFGISPDFFSFGIFSLANLFNFEEHGFGRPTLSSIPNYVHYLYDVTHSLVIFFVIFVLVWAIVRRPIWPMLAWPLHILLDIFTHSTEFFPTPFLWPLVAYRFDGVSWGTPSIFFTNIALLIFAYGMWLLQKRIRRQKVLRAQGK
ncbi:MAG: hypothetical protein COV01_00895 [Candidatus Taylorbacteria bacterium CG10_big_fil_rev_8_21_14_0_10_41_48]|uniref:Metal-dependent hydrolase n=1 Tax=Candidatus Taylorbacteria bacterium CG10_big_fil_rev_8_21_14_0_10_41_48 TaxID=1975024 RepID=A0A2M8LD75_9BACT|nr:MAG: hypothetical protein COV01_00895 [Candidatus Taylorbacteria bacterium CG10_big_fil_rev_8_21_14_0_10_41_48]